MPNAINPDDLIARAVADHRTALDALPSLTLEIQRLSIRMIECLATGGKIVWMGNGGSAADSQHLAAEIVGRFRRNRRGLASLALTTDTSILTSLGNDFGFDQIFARQVEALCTENDLVIGLSTSGNSANVVAGLVAARDAGARTAGLTGAAGGKLAGLCDILLPCPSTDTPRIQEMHILVGHILCELIDHHHAIQPA